MTNNDNISKMEKRANDLLKGHNNVYLERRLYSNLKKECPKLSRTDFKEILDELLVKEYVLERGLIRLKIDKKSKRSSEKYVDEAKPGKGDSEHQRIQDKRI